MKSQRGLTLIEVLLSIVLLAVLAVTLVPYVAAHPPQSGIVEQSAFAFEVQSVLAGIERSRSQHPTIEDIQPAMFAIGAECKATGEIDRVLQGRWVRIERGSEAVFYWIRVNESELPE